MKVKMREYGAWSMSDQGWRSDLYVFDLRGVDAYAAESALTNWAADRICIHDAGRGNLLVTWRLNSARISLPELFGEEYAFLHETFEEFLESLEDYEVLESYEEYTYRLRADWREVEV